MSDWECEAPPDSSDFEGETLEMACRHPARGPWVLEVGSQRVGSAFQLGRGDSVVVGSGRLADFKIADRAVSAKLCRLVATEDGVTVEDLSSKNGVFVGGARVKTALLPGLGATLVLGGTTLVLRAEPEVDGVPDVSLPGLVGTSAAMRRVAQVVRRHARYRAPILLQGESGTGKDVVARAIHGLSGRSGDYVPINVAAIAETLADAELFGHRRGAFTGAVGSRDGAFQQAHRGTLFLDEVAELPHSIQVKLLRVVEDGVVRPLGGRPATVDVRIVSASWADLAERVGQSRFRGDLFHRLSVVVIRLPPLRNRKNDIPALAEALLARFEPEVGPRTISSAALAQLVHEDWSGNVRELAGVLYRAAVSAHRGRIEAADVEVSLRRDEGTRPEPMSPSAARALVDAHDGNASAAARAARVPRSTFRAWLEKSD